MRAYEETGVTGYRLEDVPVDLDLFQRLLDGERCTRRRMLRDVFNRTDDHLPPIDLPGAPSKWSRIMSGAAANDPQTAETRGAGANTMSEWRGTVLKSIS